jgi:DNA invertase Pin-like site-specific DNA recombinase
MGDNVNMNKQFVYCRVSTGSQDTSNQITNLKRIYPSATFVEETASGVKARPALDGLVRQLVRGDELIVSSLDRLGRKTSEILILIEDLEKRGVILKSLREGLDYSTISGRLVTQILVSVSELERSLISQRTKAALAAKREKGIVGGRPRKFGPEAVGLVRSLRKQGLTLSKIAERTKISKTRIHQLLKG